MDISQLYLDIIKVGFHGAAIVMAILALNLLKHITQTWTPEKLTPDQIPALQSLNHTTKFFMFACVLLFVIGIGAQIYEKPSKPAEITIFLSPSHWSTTVSRLRPMVEIQHDGQVLDLKRGEACIIMQDKDNIKFNIEMLIDDIRKREEQMRYASATPMLQVIEQNILDN